MKKHIFGLAIFSFIIGAAAIVYAVFNVSQIIPAYETEVVSAPHYSSAKSCWRMKKESSEPDSRVVKVNQAVINLQSKEFSWELATRKTDAPIALHFFSKDGKGTQYITTETISGKFAHDGFLRFNNTYQWMNKRKSFDNLYVTADFGLQYGHYGSNFQPAFDAANATAVTVNHGDLEYPIVGNVEIK